MNRSRRARHGRRGLDVTLALSGVLPLVVVGALALTRPEAARITTAAPSSTALTAAELTCPSALTSARSGEATMSLSSAASGAAGSFSVIAAANGSGAPAATVEVTSPRVSDRAANTEASVVRASGASAPGMLGSVTTARRLTVWDCTEPRGEQWFTGVGAGPTQASVIELVNPNNGPAVADIEVLSDEGVLTVPALQGVAVAANSAAQFDLGTVIPRTGTMAVHVRVVRGQLGVSVRDRGERLTGGTSTEEWLAPQWEPARTNLLLGVQPGSGRHTLTIANPGDSEVTASVRLVTTAASFTPDGIKPVAVPPHAVVSVVLDGVLRDPSAADVVGIEVDAGAPVTTSLRSVVEGDLSFLVPGESVASPTTALLPTGDHTLVLAGADAVGVAVVVARDAAGREVASERVSLTPRRAATLTLASKVRSVQVTPERTSIQGAVLVTDRGSAVVRLRALQRTGAVPQVSFGP